MVARVEFYPTLYCVARFSKKDDKDQETRVSGNYVDGMKLFILGKE